MQIENLLATEYGRLNENKTLPVLYDASTSACGEVFYTWLNALFCDKALGVVVVVVVILFCGM